jgi:hypothetical protein
VQMTETISVFDRFNQGPTGYYFSGSHLTEDETRAFDLTDTLGRVLRVFVYLPHALVVSALPPSGCVVANNKAMIYALAAYKAASQHYVSYAHLMSQRSLADATIPLPRTRARPIHRTTDRAFSYRHLIKNIQETFALHTADLAEVLQVSRQTVHSWKSDSGSSPSPDNIAKISALNTASIEWSRSNAPAMPAWLLNLSINGQPLKTWLINVASGSVKISAVIANVNATLTPQLTSAGESVKGSPREPTAFEDFITSLKESTNETDGQPDV